MKAKKIAAYTLSELLVVLVISSIVISLAFVILNMVQQQISGIKKNFAIQQDIQFLERLLWKDFNQYNVAFNNRADKLMLMNPKDTVTYSFYTDFLIRENDTLPIKITDKTLFLDGTKVNNGFSDAIEIQTQIATIFVFKNKDASFYLNSANGF